MHLKALVHSSKKMALSRRNSKHKRSISYSGGVLSAFVQNGSNSSDTKLNELTLGRNNKLSIISIDTGCSTHKSSIPTAKGSSTHLKLFKHHSNAVDSLSPPDRKSASMEPISPVTDTRTKTSKFSLDISNPHTQSIAETLDVIEQGLFV